MPTQSPTDILMGGIEDYLASLNDADFADLVARVRPPAAPTTTPAGKGSLAAGRQMYADRTGRAAR